jgi:amino acid permease
MTNEQVLLGENSIDNSSSRSWFTRTFSRLGKDSLRGSILVMLLTALGTGIFTLHHLFDAIGIVLTYVCIVLFGLFYFLVSDMLIFSLRGGEIQATSINELIKIILGPFWGLIYDLVFFVYLVLASIAQLLSMSEAFYKNFSEYIWSWFKNVPVEHQTFEYFNFYFCFAASVLLFSVSVKQSIDEFRYFSLISFAIFVYIVVVCLAQSPMYYHDLKARNLDDFKLYDFNLNGFLSNYGLLLFAYNCITNFFGAVTSVHNPSQRRLRKIFGRTFVTLAFLFVVFGTAAYLSVGSKLAKDIHLFIFRPQIGDSDYFMKIGRTLLILSLCVGFGLTVYPLKIMCFELFKVPRNNISNFILAVIFTMTPVVIGSNFTGVTTYVAIAGSFSATLIAFTFPTMCGLKSGYTKSLIGKICIIIWITTLTLMGFYGSYLAFLDFKNHKN